MDAAEFNRQMAEFAVTPEAAELVAMFIESDETRSLLYRIAKGRNEVAAMRLEGIDDGLIDGIIRASCQIMLIIVNQATAASKLLEIARNEQLQAKIDAALAEAQKPVDGENS